MTLESKGGRNSLLSNGRPARGQTRRAEANQSKGEKSHAPCAPVHAPTLSPYRAHVEQCPVICLQFCSGSRLLVAWTRVGAIVSPRDDDRRDRPQGDCAQEDRLEEESQGVGQERGADFEGAQARPRHRQSAYLPRRGAQRSSLPGGPLCGAHRLDDPDRSRGRSRVRLQGGVRLSNSALSHLDRSLGRAAARGCGGAAIPG